MYLSPYIGKISMITAMAIMHIFDLKLALALVASCMVSFTNNFSFGVSG